MTDAKKTILVILLSLGTCLAAAAQDAHARFTLPHDAMWGKSAMPAGRYSIWLEFGGITKTYVTSEDGTKVSFIVIPQSTVVSAACDRTSVTLEHNESGWSVRSVCFSDLQMALYFPSEPSRTSLAALTPQLQPASGVR